MIRLATLLILALGAPAAAAPLAITLFGAQTEGSAQPTAPLGAYAAGCIAGAVRIDETAPGWQAIRLSRNRNWGHPSIKEVLTRVSAAAQAAGTPRLLVGDVGQPRGGPVPGHASHQTGLDVDIWFRPGPRIPLSVQEREGLSAWSVVSADRQDVNERWTEAHAAALEAAAEDPQVSRIFVNAAIKRRLCRTAPAPRPWLRKVRAWWGHDSHFHVRLNCPADAPGCTPQGPPPPGEGCGAALDWWFTDEALNPAPATGPRRRDVMTLADLPTACRAVLDAD
ncbi:MAG: penicillin-insensitive murein endopeptidase [Pseudomonadota bacterium]